MSGNCRFLLCALRRSVLGRQVSETSLSQSSAAGTRPVAERGGRPRFHHHWTAALRPRHHSLSALQSQLGLHSESGAPFKDDDYPPLPDYDSNPGPEKKEVYIIRAKGLPWSCTTDDLIQFFSECRVRDGVKGIHLTVNRDGKPNGQAFIELEHEEDVSKALEKHRQYLGPRYIEGTTDRQYLGPGYIEGTTDRQYLGPRYIEGTTDRQYLGPRYIEGTTDRQYLGPGYIEGTID
uniref:RRM domain-containing protein n=1 Tax=Hucho hucho TaxID=62062 RepID=A0A4W5PFD7_9TELE